MLFVELAHGSNNFGTAIMQGNILIRSNWGARSDITTGTRDFKYTKVLDVETRHEARIETRRIIKSVSNDAGPENPASHNLWPEKFKLHAIFLYLRHWLWEKKIKMREKAKMAYRSHPSNSRREFKHFRGWYFRSSDFSFHCYIPVFKV